MDFGRIMHEPQLLCQLVQGCLHVVAILFGNVASKAIHEGLQVKLENEQGIFQIILLNEK